MIKTLQKKLYYFALHQEVSTECTLLTQNGRAHRPFTNIKRSSSFNPMLPGLFYTGLLIVTWVNAYIGINLALLKRI